MNIDLEMTYTAKFNKDELDVICWVLNLADEYLDCEPEDRENMLSEQLENCSAHERAIINKVATEFANPPEMRDY